MFLQNKRLVQVNSSMLNIKNSNSVKTTLVILQEACLMPLFPYELGSDRYKLSICKPKPAGSTPSAGSHLGGGSPHPPTTFLLREHGHLLMCFINKCIRNRFQLGFLKYQAILFACFYFLVFIIIFWFWFPMLLNWKANACQMSTMLF